MNNYGHNTIRRIMRLEQELELLALRKINSTIGQIPEPTNTIIREVAKVVNSNSTISRTLRVRKLPPLVRTISITVCLLRIA